MIQADPSSFRLEARLTSWLFTGGARSGKSSAAEQLAAQTNHDNVIYLATALTWPDDVEWQQRIALHQARRPSTWHTVESLDVVGQLTNANSGVFVLVDCLTLWLTGKFDELSIWNCAASSEELVDRLAALHNEIDALVLAIKVCNANVALVTNEIGLGIVPFESSTRLFRDELGMLNMKVAAACDHVLFCVAGLQLTIK